MLVRQFQTVLFLMQWRGRLADFGEEGLPAHIGDVRVRDVGNPKERETAPARRSLAGEGEGDGLAHPAARTGELEGALTRAVVQRKELAQRLPPRRGSLSGLAEGGSSSSLPQAPPPAR